jgi:hypothetical protein
VRKVKIGVISFPEGLGSPYGEPGQYPTSPGPDRRGGQRGAYDPKPSLAEAFGTRRTKEQIVPIIDALV